ncbi:hypothetical protein [Thalassococcus sp. S3]|uniref:hypothetical protein n=1 Tax=Thalassococcus sp. S3 TaxID=2017482 RepID=UPI00102C2667|nr:hypothetical protein [Thalassococcus sp. S3]
MTGKADKTFCFVHMSALSAEGAMRVEKTITQLEVDPGSPERAVELGQLGYMQWLGSLPGSADYEAEAVRAYLAAQPFQDSAPVRVFCELLAQSINDPLAPLDLALPVPQRRGGARHRRQTF